MTFCGRLFPRTTTQERPPPSRSRYRPIFAGGRETVCAHQRDADGCKATSRSRKRKENDGLSGHDGLLHGWFLDDIYCSTDDFGRAHRRWITPLGRQAPIITWDLGGGASERGNAIRSNSQSAPPRKEPIRVAAPREQHFRRNLPRSLLDSWRSGWSGVAVMGTPHPIKSALGSLRSSENCRQCGTLGYSTVS